MENRPDKTLCPAEGCPAYRSSPVRDTNDSGHSPAGLVQQPTSSDSAQVHQNTTVQLHTSTTIVP
jgi:hypothetical protein